MRSLELLRGQAEEGGELLRGQAATVLGSAGLAEPGRMQGRDVLGAACWGRAACVWRCPRSSLTLAAIPASFPSGSGRSIRSLRWFFVFSCGLLLFIAAGLVSSGVVFFTSAGLFGTTYPYEVRRLPA